MGIEPTTSGLLDQRRSHSDNQAPPFYMLVKHRRKKSPMEVEKGVLNNPFWIYTIGETAEIFKWKQNIRAFNKIIKLNEAEVLCLFYVMRSSALRKKIQNFDM